MSLSHSLTPVNVFVTFLTICQHLCYIPLPSVTVCHIPLPSVTVCHMPYQPSVSVIFFTVCQCLCHIPYHLSTGHVSYHCFCHIPYHLSTGHISYHHCFCHVPYHQCLSHSLPPVNVCHILYCQCLCHIPYHLSMSVIFFTVNVSVIFLTICQCLSYFLLSVIVSVIFFIICHCLFVSFFLSFLVLHCPSWTIQVALPALHGYGTAATGAVLPFLPVCAVFSCVPTMVWLSVSEICNVRIDVGASDCTRVLYGHHESLHSKLALGGKALAAPGTQKACWHYTLLFCWMLYQLSHPCFHSKFLSLSHSLPAVNLWDIPYHLSRLVSW